MTFEQQGEAPRIYETLVRMRARPLPGPEDVAALTKGSDGRLAVTQKHELDQTGQIRDDRLLSSATTLLFGDVPDNVMQNLVQEGFDDYFRARVQEETGDSCSALVILIRSSSNFDRGRLLAILNLFNGQVFETTLPRKVEAILAKGWEA